MKINQKDLKIETMRGHGNGGQNRNKRETAVRVTHIPSGISAYCQDQRSQEQNLNSAMAVLQERVDAAYNEARLRKMKEMFPPVKDIIRTYNFVDNYVVDKRTKKKYTLKTVLDGNLDEIYEDK